MAAIVAEFFGIIGVDATPPSNMAELIPYLLEVLIGVFLVSADFGILRDLMLGILDWRRFR